MENPGVLNNKARIISALPAHKRTKSFNPNAKIKNIIQTPKKSNLKKDLPFSKTNINNSTSYNKQLDSSMMANYDMVTNNKNASFIQNNHAEKTNNEYNTVKSTKLKMGSQERKFNREPRNPSSNKTKTQHNIKKEVSNEKKGRSFV